MMTVCLLLIRAVKRRTQYIYILVMDKTRHSPLPNHAVLGFFNKTMYQQQFLRPIAGQQQYVFAHQSTQQSKTIGQTDANGFFKLRNRWRPLYAIGVQLGQKETVLLLH
ncbi:MAG TPA: hypothetical protein PKD90_03800, partial [Phnomibacter sp.]|nr:hypothetical protein [Phnomibacter sp.]